MKKIFLFLLLLIVCAAGYVLTILPKNIEQQVLSTLNENGFNAVTIQRAVPSLSGIIIKDITLDKDGFNKIETIRLNLHWLSFLKANKINSISIQGVRFSSVTDNWKSLPETINQALNLPISQIKTEQINVHDIIWDVASDQGAIRLEGKLSLRTEKDEAGTKNIQATLTARQHQLTLDSNWVGTIDNKDGLQLDGMINDVKINYDPVQISRGTGWIALKLNEETKHISAQIDSGSGALFNTPIKNVSLLIGQNDDIYPVLFRAEAAGVEDVHLSIDAGLSTNPEKMTLSSTLSIHNMSDLLTYLTAQNIKTILDQEAFKDMAEIRANVTYMSERRFPDGPIPFDMRVTEHEEQIMKGTFLIYPESHDIRGTAQAQDNLITLLKPLFSIPEENITDGTIRFESQLTEPTENNN